MASVNSLRFRRAQARRAWIHGRWPIYPRRIRQKGGGI